MARFIPDIKTRRWVVIAPGRALRPDELRETEDRKKVVLRHGFYYRDDCPLCLGNEHLTPPEVYRWGKSYPQDPVWLVRVVPNKYPITDLHEVIIHSPDHRKDLYDLSEEHIVILFKVFRERFRTLSKIGQVLIFNNKGKATGESLIHPHSQVVVIPKQIKLDVLLLEPVRNVVFKSNNLVAYCPEFSQWPYEIWIAQKQCFQTGHEPGCLFGTVSDDVVSEMAKMCRKIVRALLVLFPELSYNFYISPVGCWYLRIIPRLTLRAGFELGTGLYVNVVEPEEAVKKLIKAARTRSSRKA